MSELSEKIWGKLKDIFGNWASYVTLGSFLMYLLGYLATRYYLTVMGVGTDLQVLDERYVFAGAKFLVYLISTLPILAAIGLAVAGLVALARPLTRTAARQGKPARFKRWLFHPTRVALVGMAISLFLIQVVMRKCMTFSNLLVSESLPHDALRLEQLLLDTDPDDLLRYGFFIALVGGTLLTASFWWYARTRVSQTTTSRRLTELLGILAIVQFLFLPVNYGVYIQDRYLARVPDLGDKVSLAPGHKAWLVWEGTNSATFLVQEPSSQPTPTPTPTPTATPTPAPSSKKCTAKAPAGTPSAAAAATPTPTTDKGSTPTATVTTAELPQAPFGRKLVSVPKAEVKRTVILGYDQIMSLIFGKEGSDEKK
jgi:hypothetical protein